MRCDMAAVPIYREDLAHRARHVHVGGLRLYALVAGAHGSFMRVSWCGIWRSSFAGRGPAWGLEGCGLRCDVGWRGVATHAFGVAAYVAFSQRGDLSSMRALLMVILMAAAA